MTTENHKVQLEIGADASGARSEIDSIGKAADKMAANVQSAGEKAGHGIDNIGRSAEGAAKHLSRVERSMINSIQRSTAELRSLGQGTSAKFEELIKIRFLDPTVFREDIKALKEAEQQAEALARANVKTGLSAKQMAFALRGVPAQFTDIFTSLASGQGPITVLLQQGGQLKDMFGSAGMAAKALGGYVMSLVNPYTIAAAAIGTLTYAFISGSREGQEFNKTLVMTGNAVNTTVGRMSELARNISSVTNSTTGEVSNILNELAKTGKVASGNFDLVAGAIVRMHKAAGTPIDDLVKQFEELGKEPVKASELLNEKTNYLTESIYRQIKSLEDQGRASEAAALAQKAYADALNQRAPEIEQNLGIIERLWNGIARESKRAIDFIKDIGREKDVMTVMRDRIQELEGRGTAYGLGLFYKPRTKDEDEELERLKRQLALKEESDRKSAEIAERERDRNKAGIELLKEREKYLSNEEQKQRELLRLANLFEKSSKSEANRADYLAAVSGVMEKFKENVKKTKDEYSELINRLKSSESGLSPTFWKDLEILRKEYLKTGDIESYRNAVELLTKSQKFHTDAVKADAKAAEEWTRASNAALKAQESQIEAIERKAESEETELRFYGLAKSEIEAIIIARLEERKAMEEQIDGNESVVANLEREIEARKRLRDVYLSREIIAANEKAAKESAKAWENFSRDIEQSLTDALMRGFESGEGFGENFVRTLQNTLKTAALKIAVQMVVQPVMGSLGQALGYTQGGAGGGGLGGMSNIFSPISNIATSSIGGSAFGAGMLSGVSESLLGASFVGPSASLAGNASIAAGASFGSFLPAIGLALGALALFGGDLFGGKQKPPVVAWSQWPRGSADWGIPLATPWGDLRFAGKHLGDTEAEVAKIRDAFAPIAQRDYAISGLLTGEENKRIEQAIAGYTTGEMEDYSEAAMRAHFEKRLDLVSDAIGGWVDEIADAFVGDLEGSYTAIATLLSVRGVEGAEELARAFIGTLQTAAGEAIVQAQSGTFMDAYINNLNAGVGAGAKTISSLSREGESLAATFARLVSDLATVREAFGMMGRAALDFSLDAAVTASGIVEAFGGREAFGQQISAYYQEYYSESERLAAHTAKVAEAFAKLGLAMPNTHEEFRAIVNDLDLTTEAGQKTFAALLKLAPAFDMIADKFEDTAKQLEDTTRQIESSRRELAIQYAEAYGRADWAKEMRRQDVRASISDPQLLALQNAVWQLQDKAELRELEIQLMEARGEMKAATAARREIELMNTDKALRPIKQQIWAAQDARAEAEEAQRAQEEAARAAREAADEQARAQKALRDSWQRITDSIIETMRKLRGEIVGPEKNFAKAQAEFAIKTAAARAGDQTAASMLPNLAMAVVELGKTQASTAVEQALLTARTLASLDKTVSVIARKFGIDVPAYASGSSYIPKDTLAMVHEGERIIPAADNRALIQAMHGGGAVVIELRELRNEVKRLRDANSAENSAIANHAKTSADVLESSARGGRSLYTRTTA